MEDYIYGRNNVIELLTNNTRSIGKIVIMKTPHENEKMKKIAELAKERGIVYQFLPKEAFTKFGNIPHQGVIAYVSPVKYVGLEDFLAKEKKNKRIVITAGVEDPHNLGSIIRTAVCAGYDAVMFPTRRNSLINSTVEKASAGAINHTDLISVNSLTAAITKLKDNDFWIIATDIKAKDNYYDIDWCDMNYALVMGSEESGISSSIMKQADFRIKIPMLTNFDSLNVANAASIIMYESVKQIIQKSEKDV